MSTAQAELDVSRDIAAWFLVHQPQQMAALDFDEIRNEAWIELHQHTLRQSGRLGSIAAARLRVQSNAMRLRGFTRSRTGGTARWEPPPHHYADHETLDAAASAAGRWLDPLQAEQARRKRRRLACSPPP